MPLIIAPADYAAWLDAGNHGVQGLLKPVASERMSCCPVSMHASNVRNDDAECLAPISG